MPDANINGRILRLHVSDADGMAWASIDNGVVGDSVWLDRSWDGGATWDGLLGKASIPGVVDRHPYPDVQPLPTRSATAAAVLRACGDAAASPAPAGSTWTVCDGRL